MTENDPEWVVTLKCELGDDLRKVIKYGDTEYKYWYVRDDLEQDYSVEELERHRQEIITFTLGKEKIEDVTNAGELNGLTYWLDDAVVFQVMSDLGQRGGCLVSIEPDAVSQQKIIRDVLKSHDYI